MSMLPAFQQSIANGIVAASVYALIALGFSLIYGTTRFFHFAHGAVYTAGAYLAYALIVQSHAPLWAAVPAAVVLASLLGMLTEVGVYRPLRKRYAGTLVLLIASLGLYVGLQNLISLFYGDGIRTMRTGPVREGIAVLGARITPIQLLTIAAAVGLFVVVGLALAYSRLGRALRAVANDPELARVAGIDTDRCVLFAFGLGSALAAVAAILISLDVDITPTMGMNALLMGVVATIIGGVGSIPGVALGSLLLGLAQHLGVWKVGSEWQDAIAFAVLVAFLLFRPYGVFGRELKKATV